MIEWVQADISGWPERLFQRLRLRPGTAAWEQARQALEPVAGLIERHLHLVSGYAVSSRPMRLGVRELDGAAWRVVCLCSCSEAVGTMAGDMLARGDYLEGYMLSEGINEILFQASDEVSRRAAGAMARRGCGLSRRWSPGDGELELRHQMTLLEAFGQAPEVRGVTLTQGFMLRPERSLLSVYGADPGYPQRDPGRGCGGCSREDCPYRRGEPGQDETARTGDGPDGEERKCTGFGW